MTSIIHYGGRVHGKRLRLVPVLATVAASAVALAACGDGSAPSGASSSSAAPARSVAAPAPTAGCLNSPPALPANGVNIDVPQAIITVDEPGTGERRALAVRPTSVGASTLFTNSLQVSMVGAEQPSGGNRDVTVPLVTQPTCGDPLDVYLFFGAPTSTDGALTKALAVEDGQVGRARLTPGGEVRSFVLAAPPGVDGAAQAAFEQALVQTFLRLVPLPAEPVGAGARWTVTRALSAETDLTQTTKVTLGGTVDRPVLTAAVDEAPKDSVFRIPDSTQTLTIESYSSAGNGTVTVDPARAFPAEGGVALEGGRTLLGDDAAKKLTQKTGSVYRWSTR